MEAAFIASVPDDKVKEFFIIDLDFFILIRHFLVLKGKNSKYSYLNLFYKNQPKHVNQIAIIFVKKVGPLPTSDMSSPGISQTTSVITGAGESCLT